MKIWIDLTNSPHVNFFLRMIEDVRANHEVVVTCRPLGETIDMLRETGITYHVIGKHYGASKVRKVWGFAVRVLQLYRFLRRQDINVAISHSSFYSPVVARLLGVRSVYLNDNEHAAGNRISFLCADTIMVPQCLTMDRIRRQWGREDKVVRYPGVKEGVYLWELNGRSTLPRGMSQDEANMVIIRPEPWAAQYYRGDRDFMDDLIVGLKDEYAVVVLPRGDKQALHYRHKKFKGITIPGVPLTLEAIAKRCAAFIGAGGTMTREAAVLGIPSICVYQGELLSVDRYLIDEGRMLYERRPTCDRIRKLLQETRRQPPSTDLLVKGNAAYQLILETLLDHARSVPLVRSRLDDLVPVELEET